jgi:DNA-binding response OmpR family regulator
MKMDALSHPNPVLVLVEDDTDTEALVVRMLAKKGIEEITVLRDGQDAVDWFQHSAARPCLVLLVRLKFV